LWVLKYQTLGQCLKESLKCNDVKPACKFNIFTLYIPVTDEPFLLFSRSDAE